MRDGDGWPPRAPSFFNILCCLPLADDFFSITAQEIVDGFHANFYRARRLVLVEVLEAEVGFRCPLSDFTVSLC